MAEVGTADRDGRDITGMAALPVGAGLLLWVALLRLTLLGRLRCLGVGGARVRVLLLGRLLGLQHHRARVLARTVRGERLRASADGCGWAWGIGWACSIIVPDSWPGCCSGACWAWSIIVPASRARRGLLRLPLAGLRLGRRALRLGGAAGGAVGGIGGAGGICWACAVSSGPRSGCALGLRLLRAGHRASSWCGVVAAAGWAAGGIGAAGCCP